MRTEQVGRIFCCSFDDGAVVRVSRIRETSSGDFKGLVQVLDGDLLLHTSTANLCKPNDRQALARSLNGSRENWPGIIDAACGEVIHRLMQGNPTVLIRSEDPAKSESHLLHPILPMNQASLLFGKGGSTKSYLALIIAVLVGLPVSDNPFGWKTGIHHTPSLYVDNEADKDTFHRRLQQVVRGMDVPPAHVFYRRLAGALVNEVESIQQTIMEHKIGFVILDSGGKAAGGNLSDPAPVNDLFNAIGQLGVTTLVIHHQPKNELIKDKTPFGSQYWESNARRCWHIERAPGGDEDDFTVCLSCTKSNDSKLQRPTGFRVQFTGDDSTKAIKYAPIDLKTSEFASKVSLRERMIDLLKHGPLPVADIAAELGERPDTVRARLNDHKTAFIKVGQGWGLRSNEQ
jgi:hypothetical protein